MRALLVTLLLLLTAAAGAMAQTYFLPIREVARQALVTLDGATVPRYQFRYLVDRAAPETCLLVLTDEHTGAFAVTAVPEAACQARR